MKKIFKKVSFGISLGCFGFVAMLFIASAFAGGANTFIGKKTGEELLKLAGCFNVIALGYSIPSLIYEKENLSAALKVLIHMLIGTVVYLFTAYFAGWIVKDFGAVLVYILIASGAAALYWGGILLMIRIQVKKVNMRLREK